MATKVLAVNYSTLVDALMPLRRGPLSGSTADERELEEERAATCRALAILIVGGRGRDNGYTRVFRRLLDGLIAEEPIGTFVLELLAQYGTERN
jgi:hypothetical protein